MRIRTRVSLAIAGFALASASVAAHHSFAMFEMDKDVEYRGIIREWKWQNPHVHFTLEVTKQTGGDPKNIGLWDVEGGSVNIMARQGWTRASYKAGDPITLVDEFELLRGAVAVAQHHPGGVTVVHVEPGVERVDEHVLHEHGLEDADR